MSTHRLQIFVVKNEYLQSLQLCEDQGIRETGAQKMCLQPCACDPYDLCGDRALVKHEEWI